jgi:hypothetical protein
MARKILKGQSKGYIVVGELNGEFFVLGHPVDPAKGYRVKAFITVEQAKATPKDVMKYTYAQADRWDLRRTRSGHWCWAVHKDQLDGFIATEKAKRQQQPDTETALERELLQMLDNLPSRGAGRRRGRLSQS